MPNTVATPSSAYDRQELRRKLCRDLMGGTDAMREGSTAYLLKFDSEDYVDYNVRLNDSFLVGFYEEAVLNVVGKVFAKPLTLDETTPAKITEDVWPNVDLCGATADVFLYGVGIDAVVNGLSFVLIDMPTSPAGTRTVADEAASRPYWSHYKAQDVIEAMVMFENGQPKLQRLRIKARHTKPDGEWGSVCMERVLVFERGQGGAADPGGDKLSFDRAVPGSERFASFRVYEKHKGEKGEDIWVELADEAGRFIPPRSAPPDVRDRFIEIPCVAFYTEKTGHFEADPPLRDSLADLCLQHWRKKSRLDTIIDCINVPIMKVNGTRASFEGGNRPTTNTDKDVNTRELRIGPNTILFTGSDSDGADISWLEHGGVSITAGREDLAGLESNIRAAAAEPFDRASLGNETAAAVAERTERAMTRAQVWATHWSSSIGECLKWTGNWMGLADGGKATFGKGVMESLATSDDFGYVLEMWEKGRVTDEQLIAEAKRRGTLGPDFKFTKPLRLVAETRGSFDIAMVKQEPVQPKPEAAPPPEVVKEEEGAA